MYSRMICRRILSSRLWSAFDHLALRVPWRIVADIHVEVLAERTLATGAMAHSASDQMRRRPHHLGVMADLEEVIRRIGPVLEVLVLHVPHSDGEVPATFRDRTIRRTISVWEALVVVSDGVYTLFAELSSSISCYLRAFWFQLSKFIALQVARKKEKKHIPNFPRSIAEPAIDSRNNRGEFSPFRVSTPSKSLLLFKLP